jgi:hypothetical protein
MTPSSQMSTIGLHLTPRFRCVRLSCVTRAEASPHLIMAIDYNAALLLAEVVRNGVKLDNVITVGHLDLLLSPATPRDVFQRAGISGASLNRSVNQDSPFADGFLQALGATKVTALDASAYEGAVLLHDLNTPLPADYRGLCDTLIDGGSLEHVFNAPTALQSYVELVRPGGHIAIFTAANNQFGHGFYQFSPEFFFRVFSPENGLEVRWMIVYEMTRNAPMYRILDPAVVGKRPDLVTSLPTYLFVVARKNASRPLFSSWPQQADYQQEWKAPVATPGQSLRQRAVGGGLTHGLTNLSRRLPWRLQALIHRWITIRFRYRCTLDTGPCFRRYHLFQEQ